MARLKLQLVLGDLNKNLAESQQLASVALQWTSAGKIPGVPRFSKKHYDLVMALALLNVFLAWEQFLEESFALYLIGKVAPSGYKPSRYVFPKDRDHSFNFMKGERRFPIWNDASFVIDRAKMCFRNGEPYDSALSPIRSKLDEMNTIRNAIAHRSEESKVKFEKVVRAHLGALPPRTSPGSFLATTVSISRPPISYFESYCASLSAAASRLVP